MSAYPHYRIEGFNTAEGPSSAVATGSLASVGGHLIHLMEDWETVLVWRHNSPTEKRLVARYDVDGFDL